MIVQGGLLDAEFAGGQGERALVDVLPDGGQQQIARLGDAAADDDQRWVVEADQGCQQRADVVSGGDEQLHGRAIAAGGRVDDVGGFDAPTFAERFREHRAAAGFGCTRAVSGKGCASGDGFEAAGVAAPADDRLVAEDRGVPDVASAPLATAVQASTGDQPGSYSRADLDVEDVVVPASRPGAHLPERHQVHLVVHPHGSVEDAAEPVADGVAVPAGHDRRRDRASGGELDGTGQADPDAPDVGRTCLDLVEDLVEQRLDPAEHGVRAVGDVAGFVVELDYLAGQVGHADGQAGSPQLGDQQRPPSARKRSCRAARPPVDGARSPSSTRPERAS